MYACCDVHLDSKCITYFLGLFVTKFISAIQSLRLVDIPLMFVSRALSLLPATPLIDCDTLAVIRSESLLDHSVTVTAEHCCVVSVCVWVTWSGKVAISLVPTPFFLHVWRESDARSIWVMFLVTWEGRGGKEGLLLNLQGSIKLQRRSFDHLLIFLTLTLTPSLNNALLANLDL